MTNFSVFTKQQYLNIETYRKNGEAVRTPVWFVLEGDKIFIHTAADSGKVKRIRRNPRVNIAPCKMDGALLGDWVPANAREIPGDQEGQRVDKMMNKKYGLMKKLFGLFNTNKKMDYTVLEVTE